MAATSCDLTACGVVFLALVPLLTSSCPPQDAAMPRRRDDPSTRRRPGLLASRLQMLKPDCDFP